MKHYTKLLGLALIVTVVAAFLVVPAFASPAEQTSRPTNSITVTGVGQAYGAPDIAYLEVGVEMVDADVAAAFSQVNETTQRVIDALRELGVAAGDMRTTNINLWAEDRINPQTGESTGRVYHVSNNLRITVRNVDQVQDVISTAVASGATNLFGFNMGIADRSELEREARQQAMDDARARAEHLAELAGVTLGDPIIVEEVFSVPFGPDFAYGLGGGGAVMSEPPVEQGQLSVGITLNVTFSTSQ